MGLYSKYVTTKNQIVCVVFFSFIYDLVRNGFLESKRKQLHALRMLNTVSSYFGHGSMPPATLVRARSSAETICNPLLCSKQERRVAADMLRQRRRKPEAGVSRTMSRFTSDPVNKFSLRSSSGSGSSSGIGSGSGIGSTGQVKVGGRLLSSNAAIDGLQRVSGQEAAPTKPELNNRRSTYGNNNHNNHNNDDHDDNCPLEAMPTFIRIYQCISHVLVSLSFLKYVALNLMHNELFGLQRIVSCYIPGRTAILPELSPSFPLIVLSYHVIYRAYLCVCRKSLHIDCFLFVLYERQRVQSVETHYNRLVRQVNEGDLAKRELQGLFAANRMFFVRPRRDQLKLTYKLRSNRTMKQWERLREFYHNYVLFCASNFVIWSLPLATLILLTVLSETNISLLYGHCNELGDDLNPNKWTWWHKRRYVWFLFDLIDNGWLLFDTANALVWPFSSMVLCAQDMTYSVDNLLESITSVTARLEQWLDSSDSTTGQQQQQQQAGAKVAALYSRPPLNRLARLRGPAQGHPYSSIQGDIFALQGDMDDILQQMGLVDDYVSKQASWCIFCWIMTNLWYQIMCLIKQRVLIPNSVVQFMQVTAFTAISLSFAYLSITHSKARRLYNRICNIVALDPDCRTKASWLWVLEYYQRGCSRYSFHLGPYAELSLSNYLKSISWLITGMLVTISLFKHKYQL